MSNTTQESRDPKNLLGIFDLDNVDVDGKTSIASNIVMHVYRDFVAIDAVKIVLPFNKIKEIIAEESDSRTMTCRIEYKGSDDQIKTIKFSGLNDGGPSSMEYCQIMICRGTMSSHLPQKNKDKACYGILGY